MKWGMSEPEWRTEDMPYRMRVYHVALFVLRRALRRLLRLT